MRFHCFLNHRPPTGVRTTGTTAHKLNPKQGPLLGTRQGAKSMVHSLCRWAIMSWGSIRIEPKAVDKRGRGRALGLVVGWV